MVALVASSFLVLVSWCGYVAYTECSAEPSDVEPVVADEVYSEYSSVDGLVAGECGSGYVCGSSAFDAPA